MFGVIVSAATGRVRWHTGAGQTTAALQAIKAGPGETVLILDDAQYGALPDLQLAASAVTKVTPANDRYAVVDPVGTVIGAIIADPLCGDGVPTCQLIADPVASVGWTWTSVTGFVDLTAAPVPKVTS